MVVPSDRPIPLYFLYSNTVQRYRERVCDKKVKFAGQQSAFNVHQFKALAVYQEPRIGRLQHRTITVQFKI